MKDEPRVTHSASFRAMGTDIEIIGVGITEEEHAAGFKAAQRLAEQWERTFSRFRPESELSRLNAAAGSSQVISEVLYWMIEQALDAYYRTEGRFDPTILPALIATGYDRDIDLVKSGEATTSSATGRPSPGMDGIELDPESLTITLPRDVQLDLGGIAKGAYVDRIALALMTWPGGCVNAGGDLRVWGVPPDGDYWVTGIEHPLLREDDIATVELRDLRACAVATSAVNRRRWFSNSGERHHLIDPRTGESATETIVSCTAFAGSAVEAEIATKSLFVAAAQQAPLDLIGAVASLMVDHNGKLTTLNGTASDALTIFPADAHRQSA